ncbi:FAD-dependent monooxygenase [Parvularcula dongshanensis]|uniref:2-octaprenyl-6-methoxyphenol hydroxylase n=1 Tax=Parvularcula dongshanensis TaxID=1173995 RepID=A0A840I1M8_9PROT|nr:FAD-dependent monooxygenase [Parvularcula dongshanensis]MBB4658144.1 2-octaprenyl-6-methoxyphenol hydroxylase [Parvularcula dongshanensis]
MSMDRYEVCVVGAGMAGQLTALALAERGIAVALIGPSKLPSEKDPRTTALAYGTVRALRRLDVWSDLDRDAAPIERIEVNLGRQASRFREKGSATKLAFSDGLLNDQDRWEGTPLAYVVENEFLRSALHRRCARHTEICLVESPVAGLEVRSGDAVLRLEGGHTVATDLVIACDGHASRLRRASGIRTQTGDFDQDALTFTVGHTLPHMHTARQVFLPGGPLAALPLSGNRCSVIWSVRREAADSMLASGSDAIAGMAGNTLRESLGELTLHGPVVRFPLSFLYAERIYADRLALVGDTAHLIHPLAGQGFNLTVRDAATLADVLYEGRATGLAVGSTSLLVDYDRRRRADTVATAFGTRTLARALSTSERLSRTATSFGFSLVQRSDALRKLLAKEAGGDLGSLPSLMAP